MIRRNKIINIMKKFQKKVIFEGFPILSTYLYMILLNLKKFLSVNKSVCTCSHSSVFSIRNLNKSGRKFDLGF